MTRSLPTPPTFYDGPRWNGLRIGLLGGSFNPAHGGHLHIARLAMAKFDLDFVWWLVTPQNPLKDKAQTAPYQERFESVRRLIKGHPRMIATHLEAQIRAGYTYDVVARLKKNFPKTDFLWICGMDNALIFHKWDRWRELANLVPVVFIARPPVGNLVQNCPVRILADDNARRAQGRQTDLKSPGIYWMPTTRLLDISSTKIRSLYNSNG